MKKILYSIVVIIIMCLSTTYNNKEKLTLQNVMDIQINSKETYTPNSYSEYIKALNEAKVINKKIFASEDEINNVRYNLQKSIDDLDVKPNKNELRNSYETAIKINLNLYFPDSTLDFKSAIDNVYEVINDDNATADDVNNAIKVLDESLELLIIKPNKNDLNNLISKARDLDESIYTKETYSALKDILQDAYEIVNDNNATQEQIDSTVNLINNRIDNLVIANKGKYKITYSVYMISNDHVGNEWSYHLFYDSTILKNGEVITGIKDSTITISAEVYEYDSIMDIGKCSVNLILNDGFESTTQIVVRENRGRYYGNIAIWEVKCYVSLISDII